MKKTNNYEAPVAELIELNVSKDLMQYVGPSIDPPVNIEGGSY
jgi:hypothetical protein